MPSALEKPHCDDRPLFEPGMSDQPQTHSGRNDRDQPDQRWQTPPPDGGGGAAPVAGAGIQTSPCAGSQIKRASKLAAASSVNTTTAANANAPGPGQENRCKPTHPHQRHQQGDREDYRASTSAR